MKDNYGPDGYESIQSEHNWLERLIRKVPGFKGYLEKVDRREADQLLRETLASRFEEARLSFSRIHEELARDIIKAIDFAEDLGRIDNRLMGLIGKIKDAPQGYAGFFDAIKVDAAKIEQLYQFDATLMGYGETITADIQALTNAVASDGDIRGAIRTLDESVQSANTTFASRHEIMTGMM